MLVYFCSVPRRSKSIVTDETFGQTTIVAVRLLPSALIELTVPDGFWDVLGAQFPACRVEHCHSQGQACLQVFQGNWVPCHFAISAGFIMHPR